MNIGKKINQLFEHSGYRNFKGWGEAMGLPGDWLLDMAKKETLDMVNINRLQIIADYNQITIDELLKDNDGNSVLDKKRKLPDNDIKKILDGIQSEFKKDEEIRFNGFIMDQKCKDIAFDAIDVLKGLIKTNL
jgi:hypothetical protein